MWTGGIWDWTTNTVYLMWPLYVRHKKWHPHTTWQDQMVWSTEPSEKLYWKLFGKRQGLGWAIYLSLSIIVLIYKGSTDQKVGNSWVRAVEDSFYLFRCLSTHSHIISAWSTQSRTILSPVLCPFVVKCYITQVLENKWFPIKSVS